jgi:hypothetical protein
VVFLIIANNKYLISITTRPREYKLDLNIIYRKDELLILNRVIIEVKLDLLINNYIIF